MKSTLRISLLMAITASMVGSLHGQSIAEKKASLTSGFGDLDKDTEQFLSQINRETVELRLEIRRLYDEVYQLYSENAPEAEYKNLLEEINENKRQITYLENAWRETAAKSNRSDIYGLWHAPETTIEQLVIDYGSQDYVYLIAPEVASMKLSINSNLPIPRASWSEMLQLILNQNGVGIRTLNPYLRELFFTSQDNSSIEVITNKRRDLQLFPSDARVCFVLSPEPSEVRRSALFIEKFMNMNTTTMHILGRDILLIGRVSDIQDLLKLYDFAAANRGDREYRLVPIHKVEVGEMAKILATMFDHNQEGTPTSIVSVGNMPEGMQGGAASAIGSTGESGLKVVLLESNAQALFLVGTKEELHKAEEIIHNVESRIGGARDRVVFWYSVRHSDPEDLADVLERVYNLMMSTGTCMDNPYMQQGPGGIPGGPDQQGQINRELVVVNKETPQIIVPQPRINQMQPPPTLYGQEGYYQEGAYVYNPAPIQPGMLMEREPNRDRTNFIVDLKAGTIVMVVEADALPKIKELLRRLDVPKKMVQIETLLFEKKLDRTNNFGLNLLRLGNAASQTHTGGAVFNNIFPVCGGASPLNAGVFEFFMSRKQSCSGIPAFDIAYRFLLTQDDVQINSTPSILTINQTPAQIAVLEDISINTGIFEVETAKGVTLKDAFTRAQYGTTINITPTIHLQEESDHDEGGDYVTLESDITFDTFDRDLLGAVQDRPDVTRRHIVNQVNIPDGQTVILGGLRRKTSQDHKQTVPFIGELPGIGKLFSETRLEDSSTEMFIFITPHIIKDPVVELDILRQNLLCLRPGDVPYFLKCVDDAHRCEKNRLMQGSMVLLFGRPRPNYYIEDGEYCGD